MTCAEIVREIERLPSVQQVEVQEALARLLSQPRPAPGCERTRLAAAAQALLGAYQADPELTAFTALDSEDFHATR
jgi:hypothetical protein